MINNLNGVRKIVYSKGESDNHSIRPIRCCIGDSQFNGILEELLWMRENILDVEKDRYKKSVLEIGKHSRLSPSEKEKNLYMAERMYKIVRHAHDEGLDYPIRLKKEAEKVNGEHVSLEGLPFQLSESHKHAYKFVKEFLLGREDPITLVRFDAHDDCSSKEESKVDRTNYVTQILFNNDLRNKVKEVIDLSPIGGHLDFLGFERDLEYELEIGSLRTYFINGVRVSYFGIKNTPVIYGDVLIDTDLDGHEITRAGPRSGGHVEAKPSLSGLVYDNQIEMRVHPTNSTDILRSRIETPVAVSVAMERSYRNRLYWHIIESDFLRGLVQ